METAVRRREQEVWQACDDLWAMHGDFKFLTGDSIRERLLTLGKSRGSPNEIYKYRKTWVKSRKIDNLPNSEEGCTQNDDPITRAARLVHEQLRSETDQEIASIHEEYLKKEESWQKKLTEEKTKLENLIEEYSKLENSLSLLHQENDLTKKQLQAELEVRQATEKIVTDLKNKEELQRKNHENILAETNKSFNRELENINNLYNINITEKNNKILTLEEELKKSGQDYSENITNSKVEIHNLTIINNNLKEKNNTQATLILEGKKQIELLNSKLNLLKIDKARLEEKELLLKNQNQDLLLKLSKLENCVKILETKLARTRAVNNYYEK